MLTVVRCGGREAGEYSVTAENRLGNSTRDWRLRIRPLPPAPAHAPARAAGPQVVSVSPTIMSRPPQPGVQVVSPAAPSEEAEEPPRQPPAPSERRCESDSPREGVDPAPPPGKVSVFCSQSITEFQDQLKDLHKDTESQVGSATINEDKKVFSRGHLFSQRGL